MFTFKSNSHYLRVWIIFDFITKNLLGAFPKFSSVTMPASLPLQHWKIPPKSSFVIKSFKSKHTLREASGEEGAEGFFDFAHFGDLEREARGVESFEIVAGNDDFGHAEFFGFE